MLCVIILKDTEIVDPTDNKNIIIKKGVYRARISSGPDLGPGERDVYDIDLDACACQIKIVFENRELYMIP